MKKNLIALTLLLCSTAAQAEETLRVYHIGNSLTSSLTLDRVYRLFEQRDIDYQFGSQISGGKSLIRHLNYTNEPGQKWISWESNLPKGRTFLPDPNPYDGQPEPRFGLYDQALKNPVWDKVVFQIYDSSLHDDVTAISGFMDLAISNGTTNGFYVYSTWPNRPRIMDSAGKATDEPGNLNYAEAWLRTYTATADDTSKASKWNAPSRDYAQKLVDFLNKKYAGLETPIRLIPTGEVLFALDKKIKRGELPGLKELAERNPGMVPGLDENTGFADGINVFYADAIHMNPIPHQGSTIGIFVMGTTLFTVISGQNPVGLSGSDYGLDDERDAELIHAIQQTIWDVVTAEPLTGITPVNP